MKFLIAIATILNTCLLPSAWGTSNKAPIKDSITNLFIEGARIDVNNQTKYNGSYQQGGYPPAGVGVCSDVIWRAFKHCGILLKDSIDKDIKKHGHRYGLSAATADANIDFRRVKNLHIYFQKYFMVLSISKDTASLQKWKAGEIVTFNKPDHVAIVSNKLNNEGIPYLIHNQGPWAREADDLHLWLPNITGRYACPWLK